MTLRLVVNQGPSQNGPRILAPGAPPSPGPLPNRLALHLEHGEVLAWWGEKTRMQVDLIALTGVATLVTLALVSAFAPTFWLQPVSAIAPPLLALVSPTLFVAFREWLGRSAILVTDGGVVHVSPQGSATRLPWPSLRTIRRDWLGGGVHLEGAHTSLRVPPVLVDRTRQALVSRLQDRLRGGIDIRDPMQWLS